jgi:hypothetical protein
MSVVPMADLVFGDLNILLAQPFEFVALTFLTVVR